MSPLIPVVASVVLSACATQDIVASDNTARFPTFPDTLYSNLEQNCQDPTQQFVRVTRNVVECREYLDTKATAAVILSYDGTIGALPQTIVRFTAWPDGSDYLLKTEAYLNVPQKEGAPVRLAYPSARFQRKLSALYRMSGGVPEPT